jgi:predicted cation transporter
VLSQIMEQIPTEPVFYIVIGLVIITLMVLCLPFFIRIIEHNLEIFFLIMGILAVTISGLWNWELVVEALKSPVVIGSIPIGIFQVVLVFGILLFYFNNQFCHLVIQVVDKLNLRVFIFSLVLFLGLLSSIVSVIVTAVLLSEIIAVLPLDKKNRLRLVVITCFAVGLGAVLTPLGEPLSTILVQKLAGPPFHAGFTFPLTYFSIYVIPGVIFLAFLASLWIGKNPIVQSTKNDAEYSETLRSVIFRAIKVYAFVAALVLLGEGLKPLIIWYIIKIPSYALYWINILSAVLDNATLTAVEITATMALSQIICIIMGLLIAGGMLIPGNIPNIVAAGRLKISMKEWASIGLPIGFALMVVYFLVLLPIIFK